MNVGKINKKAGNLRILVAPLDWGLGHATRCIPLIKALLLQDAEVILAAETGIYSLLKKEFPQLVILRLTGYRIRYHNKNGVFFLKIMKQLPRIWATIVGEKKWLKNAIIAHEIDGVISDNRFGLHNEKVPCIFITHQLFIYTGKNLLNRLVQKINYRFINRFDECWVPDLDTAAGLAGKLSHPMLLPSVPVKYLGVLSRFTKTVSATDMSLLIMLSGPEPQRTIFEKMMLDQLKGIAMPIIFVRGLPADTSHLFSENKQVTIFNHLSADELNIRLQKAVLVVARCGYSTVMDLVTLQKKAILIPTPGQAEQEYLATFLKAKKIFYTVAQHGFSLADAINEAAHFEFAAPGNYEKNYEPVIGAWLDKIRHNKNEFA